MGETLEQRRLHRERQERVKGVIWFAVGVILGFVIDSAMPQYDAPDRSIATVSETMPRSTQAPP